MDEPNMRDRAMAAIVALQQGHCDEPLHMKLDRRELDDLADTCVTFATTIAAEARLEERERLIKHLGRDWCWDADDPETSHDCPMDWFEYVAPGVKESFVNRFQWATRLPDTWELFVSPADEDSDWTSQEFATEAEAEVACAAIRSSTGEG